MADNSTKETIDRNTSIFWAILQSSLIFGALYFFFKFQGLSEISKDDRIQIFTILCVLCAIGIGILLFIKNNKKNKINSDSNDAISTSSIVKRSPLQASKNCFKLLMTKKMFFLSIASLYTGLEQRYN